MAIKIFSDITHYQPDKRGELIDLLKPFVGKSDSTTDADRVAQYGVSNKDFCFSDRVEDSDIAVLPMSWNHYYQHDEKNVALKFIESATAAGKKVITWTSGDFGITPPYNKDVFVFRQSGYADRFPQNHRALPVFITDPVKQFFDGNEEKVLNASNDNGLTIGFCGYATGDGMVAAKDVIRTALRNLCFNLRLSNNDPQSLLSATALRTNILTAIGRHTKHHTNFLLHDQYRAGAKTAEQRASSSRAYFDNMLHSDFIVCVRGGGNFSVRFYECLAMGRIPILYETGTPLPDISPLKWNDYIVRMDSSNIGNIDQLIADFLKNRSIVEQRHKNRQLFKDQLARKCFWQNSIDRILSNA